MPAAVVLGRGVAGLTCAALLGERGWSVRLEGDRPAVPPAVMLNPVTCSLLADVWRRPDLLSHATTIRRRRVAWADEPVVDVPGPGTAVDGAALLDSLEQEVAALRPAGHAHTAESAWVLDARGRARDGARRRPAGRRCVLAAELDAAPGAEGDEATIVSVPEGWVFALPLRPGRTVVQAMVARRPLDAASTLTRMLRAAAARVGPMAARPESTKDRTVVLPAAPAMAAPLAEPGRLRVGDRGVALDPLSGDGTGNAVRAALLACACLGAIDSGTPMPEVLAHYENRLHLTYARHLATCIGLYGTAFDSVPWRGELAAMRAGLGDLPPARSSAFRLVGRSLVPLTAGSPAGAAG